MCQTRLFGVIIFTSLYYWSTQNCTSEVSYNGIPVFWPTSPNDSLVVSQPECLESKGETLTRYCNDTAWIPPLQEVSTCMTVVQEFDSAGCAPGYSTISDISAAYCYQVTRPARWDYPCFKSGGASVIIDLDRADLESLILSLKQARNHRYYWLPGRRQKSFIPVTWAIPGQNWGTLVTGNRYLPYQESIFSNCLVLDVETSQMSTSSCDRSYPTLCLYVNEANFPAKCPEGYHAFRFMPEKESCFGIEHSSAILGSRYNDFVSGSCPRPMGTMNNVLERFIFMKLAEVTELPDNTWCWYKSSYFYNGTHASQEQSNATNSSISTEVNIASLQGMVNSAGTLALMNVESRLPCMACQKDIKYADTQLSFEYNTVDQKLFLTVYSPLGLWIDQKSDKGMQCFSDANGFVKVVNIDDAPYFETKHYNFIITDDDTTEEIISKIVYQIEPVTDRSAQYWCEGHLKNFTLLQTNKILVNPGGEDEHVFAVVIQTETLFSDEDDEFPSMTELEDEVRDILDAKDVLVMDILNISEECMIVVLHVHVYLGESDENSTISDLIVHSYKKLSDKAAYNFPLHNITLKNITSSTRCLPSTTEDIFTLNWELTAIGKITAPAQFCLQENGLPVTRRCGGVYLSGAIWRDVDGKCSEKYSASNTTTFLYNVAKGQVPQNSTAHFLTEGLEFALDDLDIIIPADIYYLSMSLQVVLHVAEYNNSLIDMGDIYNIAWVMNQIMILDWDYLRLAQTLNSTSVIVDSINNIIEIIAITNKGLDDGNETNDVINHFEIAVEPKFIVQVTYPEFNNITGLALTKNSISLNFTDMDILPLYRNTTLSDVLEIENLEVAAWVSNNVLDTLQVYTNETFYDHSNNITISDKNVHIVVSIFSNDAVFQEIEFAPHDIEGRIVGISIPGYVSNLRHPVTIIFKDNSKQNEKGCGYWNFNANVRGMEAHGYWASDGCFLAGFVKNLTICKCFHLTHFGQLIQRDRNTDGDERNNNTSHERALNVITMVGCFLSLLGIGGIWTTAIVFHSWRQKPGTKVLLQLSAAIALPLVLMLLFNLDLGLFELQDDYYTIVEHKKFVCIALGAVLHYSILSGFTWMLITAILQFIRYVRVFGVHRPTRFMFKLALVGWGAPFLPVLVTLLVDSYCYIPPAIPIAMKSITPICYPNGIFFYLSVIFPIASILVVNVVLFALVLYSISRGPDGKFRAADMDLICAQLRLSVFLFFLLGLTWIFGIFSFSENGQLLSYLFCLTSTLQGFILFIYFVVCDPATRLLWVSLMKPQFRMSISSMTSVNN